jgi:hypothetical protein
MKVFIVVINWLCSLRCLQDSTEEGGYALIRRYNLEGFSKELALMSSFGGAARAVKP